MFFTPCITCQLTYMDIASMAMNANRSSTAAISNHWSLISSARSFSSSHCKIFWRMLRSSSDDRGVTFVELPSVPFHSSGFVSVLAFLFPHASTLHGIAKIMWPMILAACKHSFQNWWYCRALVCSNAPIAFHLYECIIMIISKFTEIGLTSYYVLFKKWEQGVLSS